MLDHYSLKFSKTFTALLTAGLVLVAASVLLADLPLGWRIVLAVSATLSILGIWWCEVLLKHDASWQSFALNGRQVRIARRNATEVQGEIMQRTLVSSYCIVLWVKPQQGAATAQVIFRDALADGAFREACVRLKYC